MTPDVIPSPEELLRAYNQVLGFLTILVAREPEGVLKLKKEEIAAADPSKLVMNVKDDGEGGAILTCHARAAAALPIRCPVHKTVRPPDVKDCPECEFEKLTTKCANVKAKCRHPQNKHIGGFGRCKDSDCSCDGYVAPQA